MKLRIGAGRADVDHEDGRFKLVIEIKREQSDASFENLLDSYGEQAVMYHSTNVKLGILLALDLTEEAGLGRRLCQSYKAVVADVMGDGVLCGILVVRLAGNRMTPAEATESVSRRRRSARAKAASSP
jgi:hypothetical protein